jgi:uncharacterized UPF0160 family protein
MIASLFKHKITVVTHDGNFHADDVFACATLSLWAEKNNSKLKIIRTRDADIIKKADVVVDVGGIYNPDMNRFDHHQTGRAGERENSIPYASFGLVWKQYGNKICENTETAEKIDKKLVTPIDAMDNGINITKNLIEGVEEYSVKKLMYSFRPTWQNSVSDHDKNFNDILEITKRILKNEISTAISIIEGEARVLAEIKNGSEPTILILNQKLPWDDVVTKFKKIKIVVYPSLSKDENWCAEAGKDDTSDYSSDRISFPKSWHGLAGGELIQLSGVKDALFCANNGWLGGAKTKEGAIEMAKKALQNMQN